ncbi:SDR family NAD(P)-dependent oxidoreductase [Neobacillus novalis]|uniref:SDR family NAD(P)-dependent oxidoreductase n=1 Tax=Neobacillus novalis TaxID=220687 RepID=A0AA95MXB9_9BACI|nr:SDR family NAD(P)-dependent oxidoreductase [Neobacillus novalis]WHY89136.1 SDR family NAD(P)-dependent oxidoreductase [Neobacillus novalis]
MTIITNQTAIVTGAGQGLGLAIANELLSTGKRVAFVDVDQNLLDSIREKQGNDHSLFIQADVSRIGDIKSCINTVIEAWGRVDILVNNAGVRRETVIEEITEEEWNQIISVNLGGTFFFSQSVLEIMKQQGKGRIINISSLAGQNGPLTSGAHYCASKAGQIALTKVFARSVADKGITVNAIAPAAIETPELYKADLSKLENMKKGIPVQRFGLSEEVAKLTAFLVSEDSGYITGATYDINGGLLMR